MKFPTSFSVCLVLIAMLSACERAVDDASPAAPADAQVQPSPSEHGEHGERTDDDAHDDDHSSPAATTIPAAIADAAGIRVIAAASGTIADEHEVQGLLVPPDERVAFVSARFPGPIRALHANPGDHVRAGQTLATIESNLSLTTYPVVSPITGVVLQRSAMTGGIASEDTPLFEVADLSTLWVDLHIFGNDAGHITAGVPVTVSRMSDGVSAETTLERILPGTATASQSTIARARIDNRDGLWRPGAAVRARIVVDRADVALVVPLTALQTDEDARDVVYVREGERYAERVVTLGRRDAHHVEITDGLKSGEHVVAAQSFLVKADIGKSSAEHEH